jgi:hypothetical protein
MNHRTASTVTTTSRRSLLVDGPAPLLPLACHPRRSAQRNNMGFLPSHPERENTR